MSVGRVELKASDNTDTVLDFSEIKAESKKEEERVRVFHPLFQALPNEALPFFLDAKSLACLFACLPFLYVKIEKTIYWKDKFIAIICNENEVKKVIGLNKIQSYKILYRNLLHVPCLTRKRIGVWENDFLDWQARCNRARCVILSD